MGPIIWQIVQLIVFYGMFGFLVLVLWQLAQNIKMYAQAWLTLIEVYKQNSDSMQKVADAVYIQAKSQERPPS